MGPSLCSDGRTIWRDPVLERAKTLQWGRRFAATEGIQDVNRASARETLQWGRRFAATEGFMVTEALQSDLWLQWGRRFAATEGLQRRDDQAWCDDASMGPSLCSDGRLLADSSQNLRPIGFNGAVALQRRKAVVVDANDAITGISFNGAVALQRRKACHHDSAAVGRVRLQWGRRFAATEGF